MTIDWFILAPAAFFAGMVDAVVGGGGLIQIPVLLSSFPQTAIPTLFLLISLRAAFPLTMDALLTFYLVVSLLGFIGWGGLARVIRGMVLSVREKDYVQAAGALGARR